MLTLKNFALAATIALGAISAVAVPAHAVAVNCPGTAATTDREFTLDPATGTATCKDYGVGNLSGNPGGANPDPLLDPTVGNTHYLGAGYVFIDKWTTGKDPGVGTSTNNVLTGVSVSDSLGSFAINLANLAPVIGVGKTITGLILALKSGEGKYDPDWAAFSLTDDALSGTWAISSQGLSHINLYAVVKDKPGGGGGTPGGEVPLPAGLPLLLTALAGMGWLARRNKTA